MPSAAKSSIKADAKPRQATRQAALKPPAKRPVASRAEPSAKPAKPPLLADAKPTKSKQPLVRDSFTMPAADFDLITSMKERAIRLMRPAKKSELLRAGLYALAVLNDTKFRSALNALTPLKPGRPKKSR